MTLSVVAKPVFDIDRLVFDIDRPRDGVVRVDQQPLLDLRDQIAPPDG